VERHPFDGVSLVFGVALTGLGALLIAGVGEVVVTGSWIGPAAAILIGIVLLVAAPRRRREATPADAADESASPGS
jgi:hypothetical protein